MTVAPIDCRSAMRELWEYLDDELPPARHEQIRVHLATCHGCTAHVEFCRAFLLQIDRVPVPAVSVVALRESLAATLLREGLTTQER